MTHTNQNHAELLDTSLQGLRSSARSFEDICRWFEGNLDALNLPLGTIENELLSVTTPGSFSNVFKTADIENIAWCNKIEVTQNASALPNPAVRKYFNTQESVASQLVTAFDVRLPFKEWPFLTSALAYDVLTGELFCPDEDRGQVEYTLSRYVPEHFPGFTWQNLQSLHSAELLPCFSNGYLKFTSFTEMLFKSRDKMASALPPDSLIP